VEVSLKVGSGESLPDAARWLKSLSSTSSVYSGEDATTNSSTVKQCPECASLFVEFESVEHLVMMYDHDVTLIRLTDPVLAFWHLRRHTWGDPERAPAYHLATARMAAAARSFTDRAGLASPAPALRESYEWYAAGPRLMRLEIGEHWAALPHRAQWLCALEAGAMAVDVWEAHAPKEGYEYCCPEILESDRVEYDVCRRALENLRNNVQFAGRAFEKRYGNPMKRHFEPMATGELSLGSPQRQAFEAVSALFDAATVERATRKAVTDIERDSVWIGINLALTARCLDLLPGISSDQLPPDVIVRAAEEWWAKCRQVIPL
jgi:hypothetical protein